MTKATKEKPVAPAALGRTGFREANFRRGVQMTASARKPAEKASWREEKEAEETEAAEADNDLEATAQDSNLEWAALEQEVKEERRRLQATKRVDTVVDYDDVASDERSEDEADDKESADEGTKSQDTAAETAASKIDGEGLVEGPQLPPAAVVTAGQVTAADKKRGGHKRTGASRRKKDDGDGAGGDGEEDEENPAKKKKGQGKGKDSKEKKEEDPDRWIKLKLKGEEKLKKIDCTRIVHYHDFDRRGILGAKALTQDHEAASSSGDFRSRLRRDLYDDDDDDEAGV